ncbi:MAG TPA: aspartate-semialdehyde dehydrogenase [Gemmatimonadaceae bacterium]|nr:aspartate-semialdehyde dehydrogenase [Gemmatimonadaceae bacterium]
MSRRWPVAVLGATGAVGQTFVRLLAGHPWFELRELAASERSVGLAYGAAAHWLEGELPNDVAARAVIACDPALVSAPVVFSALDASAAGELEASFARAGKLVLSNARAHRMDPDVPLVIPEVNGGHLAVIGEQRRRRGWSGAIVTNANCAATVAAVALAPLHETFRLRQAVLMTMQAVSGAGYPGVPSLDIVGNVIPWIADEEEKIERELCKLLGEQRGDSIVSLDAVISAQANRVPVEHGHTVCISASFDSELTPEEAREVIRGWRGYPQVAGLPSAPERPLVLLDGGDRPQPRRDANAGNGMTVSVGRVRDDNIFDLRMIALGHNTIRGAAGGSVLNAELLAAMDQLPAA